jgi:hypothetical protein
MTALLAMLEEFESKIDPMKQFMFAFNFHEWGSRYYPHGGTGWLFSNYAVHQFLTKVNWFDAGCRGSIGDDVYMPHFFRIFGLNVESYQTSQFIVTFPNKQLDVVLNKEFDRVDACPSGYSLYWGAKPLVPGLVHRAASIHMHTIPMDLAYKVLQEAPDDFAVTFPNSDTPTFCRMSETEEKRL